MALRHFAAKNTYSMVDLMVAMALTAGIIGFTLLALWQAPTVFDMRDFPEVDIEVTLE